MGCFSSKKQIKYYTYSDVANHHTSDDLWIILNDKVYDLTAFYHYHPGGTKPLLIYGGGDGTHGFEMIKNHNSKNVNLYLKQFYIGDIQKN